MCPSIPELTLKKNKVFFIFFIFFNFEEKSKIIIKDMICFKFNQFQKKIKKIKFFSLKFNLF